VARITNLGDFKKQVKWFDIKNYDSINDLNENEILNQVTIRVHWIFFLKEREKYSKTSSLAPFLSGYKEMFDVDWELITKGQAILNNQFKQTHHNVHFSDDLPALLKVEPENLDKVDDLPFTLNTREFTDDEILSQVKKHLLNLRKKDSFRTPKKVKFTNLEKTKLKTHKPIPVLDLKIWELLNDKTISQAVFERTVFSTDCIDYKQGVLPYIDKLLKLNSRSIPIL